MKKRMIALVLALMLAASFCGCEGESPEETTKATQTETTPITTEAATETVEAPVEFPDVSGGVYFPMIQSFGNAVLVETGEVDEENVYLIFSNGSEADLNLFITLCGYCGLYRRGGHMDDGSIAYYLLRPGEDFMAIASLMSDGETLYIQFPRNCQGIGAAEIQVLTDYYLQDLTIPTSYGPNVMPQFFASIGRSAPDMDGLVSNVFSGEQETCWCEIYYGVDYPVLHSYFSDMMLYGFDIKYENVQFSEGTMVISAVYMLDNGSSQVAVSYNAENNNVIVYYEPGVDRYLFHGAEYAKYIPKP